jgi:glyoxylase-like metal-dependent hydrolase (beta-lactamase superfamily II)
MAIGDVYEATLCGCTDLYYVDTGMYDVEEYGSVWILDSERPALVDTGIGTNYERVLDALDEVGIAPSELEVIAPTHVHLDHAGGTGFLVEECPNAEVYVHEIGAPHLVDPERLWEGTKRAVGDMFKYYVEPEPVPEDRIRELQDGDIIDLGDHALRAHHAPGHAPHQVVFFDPANDVVFTGDAAGIYTPSTDVVHPTSPPSNFDADRCLDDVEMIRDLDPSVLAYGHFGPAETADRLGEYERVLASWVQSVAEKRAEFGDHDDVVEYFVANADGGDVWGREKAEAEARLNARGVLVYLDEKTE